MADNYINEAGERVTFIPLVTKRCNVRKILIRPNGETRRPKEPVSYDLALIRTLGKAFYWQKLIDTGEAADAMAIATRFNLDRGWVCEVLRMTLLAPDVVSAIHEGTQPRNLNLHAMRGRESYVPLVWEHQRELFGFSNAQASPSNN